MTKFELGISGVRSDRSNNNATTTHSLCHLSYARLPQESIVVLVSCHDQGLFNFFKQKQYNVKE